MKDNNKTSGRKLLEIRCSECGTSNDPIFTFCENCGMRLPRTRDITDKENFTQSDAIYRQEELQQTENCELKECGADKRTGRENSRRKIWYIIAALFIILDGYLIYGMVVKPSEFTTPEHSLPEAEEVEEKTETFAALHEIKNGDMTVISWDWDWDSARKTGNNNYQVDGIFYVRNDSTLPAVSMNYSLGVQSVKCWGFVASGEEGVMVCTLDTDEKNFIPDKTQCQVKEIYTNDNLSTYKVPSGRITNNYGEDDNSYDVSLSNDNDMSLASDAKLVAILIKKDKIRDSDATGKLTREIEPGVKNCEQKNAFYDPHLYHYKGEDKKAFKVFAIDIFTLGQQ